MMNLNRICITGFTLLLLHIPICLTRSQVSSSFELRYFTADKDASGQTDFKGECEWLDTNQRVEFLQHYAAVASKWFMDSALDRQVVDDAAVERFLAGLKPQPLPEKRRKIVLEEWKKTGIGMRHGTTVPGLTEWIDSSGTEIIRGRLRFLLAATTLEAKLDTISWRARFQWKAMSGSGEVPFSFSMLEGKRKLLEAGFHSNGNIFYTDNGFDRMGIAYQAGKWYTFTLEIDLVNNRYNLLVDDRKIGNWAALRNNRYITGLSVSAGKDISMDEVWGLAFDTTDCDRAHPYRIQPLLKEDFDDDPDPAQWYMPGYDDGSWETDRLPIVHGGALESGEDLYLRKRVRVGEVQKAFLNIETLDPGGEIWINGQVVHVTHDRHPVRIDISDHLIPFRENQLAIRVFSSYVEGPLYHSSHDRNIGWFCGRAWIDLSEKVRIDHASAFTSRLEEASARQHHLTALVNDTDTTFKGLMEVIYTPWFPVERRQRAAISITPVMLFARDSLHLRNIVNIPGPEPWTHKTPSLYKVQVRLLHQDRVIDDVVFTTGIRTVSQEGGTLRINGAPELLGGAQTMGFRMPIEHIAKWNRCAPQKVLAEELLSVKEMGNTLRIHVHSAGKYAHSVNDPRVAEMADQLGIMLIWPTSSWIREGEWGGIDFGGYPRYMKQVFNHPSIIIWEGSNHPNRFSGKPLEYSNRFITKIYRTIYQTDSSRLIAPSSYNRHFAYRNDDGTINQEGDSIVPCKEWTAPMIVRGNQDALTGYGAEWHNIRKWPDPYRKSLLDSPERAYINFEHEESIGMQNFRLARGKPWYQMPSYENHYDLGSIGREFMYSEWRASQAWQAFSAYESMKWQRLRDIDGFSWCCLHGGPNSGTYRKPIIDALGHAKLAFYINKMVLQDVLAGSSNTDVVYGKKERIEPVIMNLGDEKTVDLKISIKTPEGEEVDTRTFPGITLAAGRTASTLPSFKPKLKEEGYYVIEYYVLQP